MSSSISSKASVTSRLVLIDANSLLHRAYHALPSLTTSRGESVGAVFGFTSMLLRVLQELEPEYIAVAWDTAKPTFRHQKYAAYKQHRPEMPEDLLVQEGRVKRLLEAFNIPQFAVEGYEADDIIGTLAKQAFSRWEVRSGGLDELDSEVGSGSESRSTGRVDLAFRPPPPTSNQEVVIVTGDLDALQLVNNQVKVYTSQKKFSDTIIYGPKEVKDRYGLEPSQLVDYRALRGDPSDNIPGVPGVGEKTATKLLQQYQVLEAVYEHLDEVNARWAKLLRQGKESAFLSQDLARIRRDVPIKLDLEKCRLHDYDRDQLLELFQELEFRSLISRLPKKSEKSEERPRRKAPYKLVQTEADWSELDNELSRVNTIAVDVETNGLDLLQAELVGVSLAVKPGCAWFIPAPKLSAMTRPPQKLLQGKKIVAHNLKFDAHVLSCHGVNITRAQSFFDTMLAAHLLQEGQGRVGLKELAFNRLGRVIPTVREVTAPFYGASSGTGQAAQSAAATGKKDRFNWSQVPLGTLASYACTDADITLQLYRQFEKELNQPQNEKLSRLFYEVEMPLLPILIQMEKTGVLVDKTYLGALSSQLTDSIAELEKEIYSRVGHQLNLNSPKQLGEVLFDELKLPMVKKTKTQRSTDESVLLQLRHLHPVIDLLLKYRQLFKIKSTYIDKLPAQLDSQNRVHTQFNQARTATGRLSSENPNLQNIPIDSEVNVRKAIVAPRGCKLLVADYSQIELRIMAHFSQDKGLLESFENDQDIHAATAARIFDKFINEITPKERRAAKTINFGIMYGLSAHGLSEALQIEHIKAAEYINDYFESYPRVKLWIKENLEQARQLGFVESLLGRRRRLPDLTSSNFVRRSAAERMATNMPIQATAADLIKLAMIKINRESERCLTGSPPGRRVENLKSRLVLQVHDELIFEVPEAKIEQVGQLVQGEMEKALKLSVPVKVDLKIGDNWGELQEIRDQK